MDVKLVYYADPEANMSTYDICGKECFRSVVDDFSDLES